MAARPWPSRELVRVLWLAVVAAVIVGSLLPGNSAAIRMVERLPLSDKVEHLGMYALLSFLPCFYEQRRVILAVGAGAVGLGVALEFAQLATGWRDFEIADMFADGIGTVLGLLAGAAIRRYVRLPGECG